MHSHTHTWQSRLQYSMNSPNTAEGPPGMRSRVQPRFVTMHTCRDKQPSELCRSVGGSWRTQREPTWKWKRAQILQWERPRVDSSQCEQLSVQITCRCIKIIGRLIFACSQLSMQLFQKEVSLLIILEEFCVRLRISHQTKEEHRGQVESVSHHQVYNTFFYSHFSWAHDSEKTTCRDFSCYTNAEGVRHFSYLKHAFKILWQCCIKNGAVFTCQNLI